MGISYLIQQNNNDNHQPYFKNDEICGHSHSFEKINEDKFIGPSCDDNYLSLFSISELKIIKNITIDYKINIIKYFDHKGIFLVVDNNRNIYVYRIDNYELIQTIKTVDEYEMIVGIEELNTTLFITFGNYKIWNF